jgi:hypothetical protein
MIFWDKEKKLEKFIEFTRRSVNALYYSDDAEAGEGFLNQIEAIISLVEAGMLEQARLLIDDVEFSDIQVQLFCICAIASNGAEEDLQALRELIEFQRDHGDDAQTSLFLFIFFYSRSKDDLRQLRARIKRADPFGQVHSYLALF